MTITDDDLKFDVGEVPPDENPFSKGSSGNLLGDIPRDFEAPTTKSKPDTEFIIGSLKKTYFNIGMMAALVDTNASVQIVRKSDDLAESWRTLLDSDTKLRRKMKNMVTAGGWGTVIIAHLVVAIPIAQSHGLSFEHLITKRRSDDDES
jgi:hypothetical protein